MNEHGLRLRVSRLRELAVQLSREVVDWPGKQMPLLRSESQRHLAGLRATADVTALFKVPIAASGR